MEMPSSRKPRRPSSSALQEPSSHE
jgi:hypothetical protein